MASPIFFVKLHMFHDTIPQISNQNEYHRYLFSVLVLIPLCNLLPHSLQVKGDWQILFCPKNSEHMTGQFSPAAEDVTQRIRHLRP